MKTQYPNQLARFLKNFLSDYLPGLRGMSLNTVHSYRDTLVLLLRFIATSNNQEVVRLDLEDITSQVVINFLAYLEKYRHNKISTRNIRLAAIHAFFRYVAFKEPTLLEQSQQILAVPFKRSGSQPVDYLEFDELQAIFNSVDRSTSDGRRDYTLLVTMFNTGARVQEILDLRAHDLQLTRPFQVRLWGKGRKVRICPLWPQTSEVLHQFCSEIRLDLHSDAPVFLNHRGAPLSRYGVRYILAKQCKRAKEITPTLANKRLHPHSMRHSTAIHMLKSGIDIVTISQWLGHASINTTNRYAKIDLEMKRDAIAKAEPPNPYPDLTSTWKNDASILDWLESL